MVREISIEAIDKTYSKRVKALSNVTLRLRSAETMMLLGPNGAGKTTLIKILAGILGVDSGRIHLDGKKYLLGDYPSHWFGVALQEIGLWPHLSVLETLAFIGKMYRLPADSLQQNVKHLIEAFRLEKVIGKRISELSDGMRRRVNLVCAMIHNPSILLLDEPSLGLDVESRFQLWNYLKKIKDEKEKILLISTHDMEEAEKLGDRIAVLSEGKLIREGSPAELKNGRADLSEVILSLSGTVNAGAREAF